jgi:uncharacterized membrane protein YeaQ/YmgE (transglycosylase-associated protein family)
MGIVVTSIIGLAVGAAARLLVPGRESGGLFMTLLLAIAGAFTASFLGLGLGGYAPAESAGVVASLLGAMVLLAIHQVIRSKEADR